MERYRCLFKGFAWILIMCIFVVSCRRTIIHNFEVDDVYMQKVEFKDSVYFNSFSGDYYLLVVKLKDANIQTHYLSIVVKDYLNGIPNEKVIRKVDLWNAKDSVISDSLIDAEVKYPFGFIKFDFKNNIPSQLSCKKIEKLSDVPKIISGLRVSVGYFVYDKSTGNHYFSTIIFVRKGVNPKTISIETDDGAFRSKINSNPVHAEVIDTITNYDYLH
jgi:hypothetical protein